MSAPVEVARGDGPVVLGIPHTGTEIPDEVWDRLDPRGRARADTDWHVERLYEGLMDGATTVRATFHRYVIDANRDPSGESLYPGRNTTGLVPLTDFDGRPIHREGAEPDAAEIARRREAFHAPYHAALAAELERVRARHGVAILHDCHSIRSEIPFLFEGTLPDFNIGTNEGRSCAPEIEGLTERVCKAARNHSFVTNGRFKGGWTTQHYGRPEEGMHAIQMELAQRTYMTEAAPWTYDDAKGETLRVYLRHILICLEGIAPALRNTQ